MHVRIRRDANEQVTLVSRWPMCVCACVRVCRRASMRASVHVHMCRRVGGRFSISNTIVHVPLD